MVPAMGAMRGSGVFSGWGQKALTGAPADDTKTGVMLALYPDEDTAAALALPGGLPASELHITVAYAGKTTDVDREALITAAELAAARGSLTGTYSGLARFTNTGNDRGDALVALFDSAELEKLRRAAVDALADEGIEIPTDHGFTAHTTLGYLPAEDPSPIERIEPRQVTFDALEVVYGPDRQLVRFAGPSPDAPTDSGPALLDDEQPAAPPAPAPAPAAAPAEVETKTASGKPRYDRENLPAAGWGTYRKTATTRAVRIQGPFSTVTREGEVSTDDGWLALDSAGWPYPIADAEMQTVYVEHVDVEEKKAPFTGAAAPFGQGGIGGGKGEDAGPRMATGAFVALGNRKGRVDMIVSSGTVPGAKHPSSGEPVEGSKDSPAARVVIYEAAGNGTWKSTGKKFASSVAKLRRIPPLRTRGSKSLDEALAATLHHYDHVQIAFPGVGVLREVYARGVKSWPGIERTALTAEQWALGRVDAFAATCNGIRPEDYRGDDDLLPPDAA
jgi:2'-5' RNA ligase